MSTNIDWHGITPYLASFQLINWEKVQSIFKNCLPNTTSHKWWKHSGYHGNKKDSVVDKLENDNDNNGPKPFKAFASNCG